MRAAWLICLCFLIAAFLPVVTAVELESVAELEQGPGNITVTPDGRIVMSLHQFFAPQMRVAELLGDGSLIPFPNPGWSQGEAMSRLALDSVLGLQSDSRGVVWMLDNGLRSKLSPRLVAWDTRADRLHRIIALAPPATPANAFVNDLAIDETHGAIYIADPAGGDNAALIVVDLESGTTRRVLQGDRSVVPEDMDLVIDGRPVEIKRPDGSVIRPRVGVNPIALDAANHYLYFGPMHGNTLYRVATRDLLDLGLSEEELAARVQQYADKPICDGISLDDAGNVYISDIGNNAVGIIGEDRHYRLLSTDPRLSWPDAFSYGPDGYLYTVANQLHRTSVLNGGVMSAEPPYHVLRIRTAAPGVTGR